MCSAMRPEQIVQGVCWKGEKSVASPSSAITICPRMPRVFTDKGRTTASSTPPSICKAQMKRQGGAGHQRHQTCASRPRGRSCHVEDYRSDQLIDDIRLLAKGFQVVPGSFWGAGRRVRQRDPWPRYSACDRLEPAGGFTSTSTCWTGELLPRVLSQDGNKIASGIWGGG